MSLPRVGAVLRSRRLALPDALRRIRRSDFIHKIVETVAARFLIILTGLIGTVAVARGLGPEGRGLLATASTVTALGVQFGNLGLHASATYYVARDPEALPVLVGNTLAVGLGVGGAGALVAWLVFSAWPHLAPLQGPLLWLSLLAIPLGLSSLFLQNLLIGLQLIRTYNVIDVSSRIAAVLLTVVIIYAVTRAAPAVFLVGVAASAVVLVWALRSLRGGDRRALRLSWSLFREQFHFGMKAYVAALFSYLVVRVDILMVKYVLGTVEVGFYSVAVAMADLVYVLPVVVGTILFPRLASMDGDAPRREAAQRTALALAGVMLAMAAAAALLAGPVTRLLFGAEFRPAVAAFVWLLPGIVFLSVNTIYMNYFASMGMLPIAVYSSGVAALANIVLNAILLPVFGIVGASIASTISYGMMLTFSLVYLVRTRAPAG